LFQRRRALTQVQAIAIAVIVVIAGVGIYYLTAKPSTPSTPSTTPSKSHDPVLFVHGRTKDKSDWDWMINKLVGDGWSRDILYAYTFTNPSDATEGANMRNAQQIAAWVDQILAETGAKKVDLVSHSMGGLSTRFYIKSLGGVNKVDDYVSLACPQHGSTGQVGAEAKPDTTLLEMLNAGDETPGGVLSDTLGPRDDPVGEGGYTGTHVSGNVTWTTIWSKTDGTVVPGESGMLDGAKNLERDVEHSAFLTDEQVYALVKAAIEG
jgi:triacylglycerol lipase